MDLKEYCQKLGEITTTREGYLYYTMYEDDLIACFGCCNVIDFNNPKLSLFDNLDYKNDLKVLYFHDGFDLYKLEGEHLDRIRGKLIQIPDFFKLDVDRNIIKIFRMDIEHDCILNLISCKPIVVWFKNCKIIKVENTNCKN